MKYILRDYAGVEYEGEEPVVYTFKNKDEVIAKLLSFCNAEAPMEYEVVR
jgi:hypothetical protein|tara:strand:- start:451 stop:600 length:150 start_codon:yes stop_codon:yes gene_type:complete